MGRLDRAQAHKDQRGIIVDLLVDQSINAVTYLTLAPGAVRGNHFHKETTQWTFVMTGRITYAESTLGGLVESHCGEPGDLFVSEPSAVHAVRANIDSSIIVFTSGPRAGDLYEQDTYRVSPPIIV